MEKIIIFGNGKIGELAEYYFRTDSQSEVVAFTADKEFIYSNKFCKLPLIESSYVLKKYPPEQYKMFIALSYSNMNKDREQKYLEFKKLGYRFVSYISTNCTIFTEKPIGENCLILEDNTIQPFVTIGNNITLWSGNHIGHGSIIGDHCFISSHVVISGNVHIKPYCFIGVNATLRDGLTIEKETLIGAGAVIMENTIERGVYVPPKSKLITKTSNEFDL